MSIWEVQKDTQTEAVLVANRSCDHVRMGTSVRLCLSLHDLDLVLEGNFNLVGACRPKSRIRVTYSESRQQVRFERQQCPGADWLQGFSREEIDKTMEWVIEVLAGLPVLRACGEPRELIAVIAQVAA